MKRLVARVPGKVQKAGYRSKVVTIARAFGITGSIQNLPDGRAKRPTSRGFAEDLKMRNAIIDVADLEKGYSDPTGEYEGFYKLVGEDETDAILDRGVEYLKKLVDVTRAGFGDLGHKMDVMLDKQDDRKVFEVWGRTSLLLEIRPFRGRGRPFGWWDRPGRIDPMIGGSGDILLFVARLILPLNYLIYFGWNGYRMGCARSRRDRVECGELRPTRRVSGLRSVLAC